MKNKASKARIISDVCAEVGVDQSFIEALLDLETQHGDLLAWGAKPHLRRDVAAIVETALAKYRAEVGDEATPS
jgi:hypothetical protein